MRNYNECEQLLRIVLVLHINCVPQAGAEAEAEPGTRRVK